MTHLIIKVPTMFLLGDLIKNLHHSRDALIDGRRDLIWINVNMMGRLLAHCGMNPSYAEDINTCRVLRSSSDNTYQDE